MKLLRLFLVCVLMVIGNSEAFSGSVTLGWNPNSEPDLLGYRVYRGTGSCSSVPLLDPLIIDGVHVVVKAPATTYTDTTVPQFTQDSELCYEITAIDIAGNESGRSNRVVEFYNVVPPLAPRGLVIQIVGR